MSTLTDKNDIIKKIRIYTSLANSVDLDSQNSNFIKSNPNSPIDYIFDVIRASVGDNGLESLLQLALTKILSQKKLNDLSDKIYDSIYNVLPEKGVLPESIKNNGLKIPIKSIDPTDSFRNSNLSGGTKNTNNFFQSIKNQVLTNANTEVPFSLVGITYSITLNYDENTDELRVGLPDINLLDLFDGLRGLIGPMFNSSIIVSEILKILFHTNFKKEDAQILTIIRAYTNYENQDIFKLDLKKLLDIEYETSIEGYSIDINCFKENITITEDQINNLIADPTIKKFTELVPELNASNTDEVLTNSKNNYFKKLLNAIIEALLSAFLKQPVVLFFINIYEKIQNLDFNFEISIPDMMDKLKALMENIFNILYEDFFCIIFNWVKKNILKLVIAVAIKLLKEQLERRSKVLLSLTGGGNTVAQI